MVSFYILFIWSNSLINSDKSNSRSDYVVEILRNIKHAADDFFGDDKKAPVSNEAEVKENNSNTIENANENPPKPPLINSENISAVVRKSAHFLEFMVLGILLSVMNKYLGKPKLITILLICQSVAVIDEFIQSFLDRTDKVRDIIIDIGGAVTGIVLVFVICWIIKKVKK